MRVLTFAVLACLFTGVAAATFASETVSSTKTQEETEHIGMDGHCPVCLVEMKKQVKGKPEFSSVYDGVRYLFPGEEQKKMFDADPEAYVPAMGGDCAVCKVEMGESVKGKPEFFKVHDGRLFLFPGEKQLKMFEANPGKYADADLGMGGHCPVCLVEMQKQIKGKAEFSSVYDGVRYLFPGEEQKKMFDADPIKYAPAMNGKCTVCKVEMNKDVEGSAEHFIVHNGRLYLFPGEEQKKMFSSNRKKYENADLALNGHCTVCKVEMGKEVKGSEEFAVMHKGKRYLFPAEKQMKMFLSDPEKYTVDE